MRKIIAGLFISLDGVCEGPGPGEDYVHAGWTMPYWSDEIGQYIGQSVAGSDGMLLGRITYLGFQAAFANQDSPDAVMMNSRPKYVVSNTLTSATWGNSTIISGNIPEQIAQLKQAPGGNLTMSGSMMLVQSLIEHDLLDELDLLVYPVVLGTGRKLFQDGVKKNFKLVEARPTSSGVVLMRYERADS